jgi:uncharacterized protein YgiM (DUF1202 family)
MKNKVPSKIMKSAAVQTQIWGQVKDLQNFGTMFRYKNLTITKENDKSVNTDLSNERKFYRQNMHYLLR